MYKVYKVIAKGWHRLVLKTTDHEYAVAVALNSEGCYLG